MAKLAWGRGPILPICRIFAVLFLPGAARPVTQVAATAGAGFPESPGTLVRERDEPLQRAVLPHGDLPRARAGAGDCR
jgi:hypothetical protein